MPIDFLKMFIDTGIPFDKYLVQTLRTQSKCHVGTIKYEATAVYADRNYSKTYKQWQFLYQVHVHWPLCRYSWHR